MTHLKSVPHGPCVGPGTREDVASGFEIHLTLHDTGTQFVASANTKEAEFTAARAPVVAGAGEVEGLIAEMIDRMQAVGLRLKSTTTHPEIDRCQRQPARNATTTRRQFDCLVCGLSVALFGAICVCVDDVRVWRH